MSVINNMLKQLDARPSSFTPLNLSAVPQHPQQSGSHRLRLILALIMMIVAALLGYQYYRTMPLSAQLESADLITPPIITSPPVKAENASPPVETAAELTGLQIQEGADYMELSLQLGASAQAFLRQQSTARYVFLITNSDKQIIAPQLEHNRWLKRIDISQDVEGVQIRFETLPNVLVETKNHMQQGSYQWSIRLTEAALKSPAKPLPEIVASDPEAAQKKVSDAVPVQQQLAAEKLPKRQMPVVKMHIKASAKHFTDNQKLAKAQRLLRQREWSRARSQLHALLGSRVDRKARLSLLELFKKQSDQQSFGGLLQQSLQQYPQDMGFMQLDAGLLFEQKKYAGLIEKYQTKATQPKLLNLVAAAQQASGDHAAAIKTYRRTLALNKNQPRSWISLAISLEQVKQFDAALTAYRSAQSSGALNARLQQFCSARIQQLTPLSH